MDLEILWKNKSPELKISHADHEVRSKLVLGEEKVVYTYN
jgi:hypothetical protein